MPKRRLFFDDDGEKPKGKTILKQAPKEEPKKPAKPATKKATKAEPKKAGPTVSDRPKQAQPMQKVPEQEPQPEKEEVPEQEPQPEKEEVPEQEPQPEKEKVPEQEPIPVDEEKPEAVTAEAPAPLEDIPESETGIVDEVHKKLEKFTEPKQEPENPMANIKARLQAAMGESVPAPEPPPKKENPMRSIKESLNKALGKTEPQKSSYDYSTEEDHAMDDKAALVKSLLMKSNLKQKISTLSDMSQTEKTSISMKELKRSITKYMNMGQGSTKQTAQALHERVATGIEGFDELIEGGFIRDSAVLINGGPGSGKSIFAMQFLVNGIDMFDENGVYISFEQEPADILDSVARFNWDVATKVKDKRIALLYFSPEQISRVVSIGGGPVREIIETINAKRVVIDSITAFTLLAKNEEEQRKNLFNLFKTLKKWGCTTLLISEHESSQEGHHHSVEEYSAEAVIMLYHEKKGEARERSLEIFKMRNTNHSKRIYPMQISSHGVVIYPDQNVY